MERQRITIEGIPAVLWGPASDRLFLAVHGDGSSKDDTVIELFAREAAAGGYRTLSLDLPEHGERRAEPRLCNPPNCIEDLAAVMSYARQIAGSVGLFGCSIGAYFGMMAFGGEPLERALFLSPVVDLQRLIEDMMLWFGVSRERLEREGEVATPMRTLYWDYYRYVAEHPVMVWETPTALLCGQKDDLCRRESLDAFAERWGADLTVFEGGEHFFHTREQLAYYERWLRGKIERRG